MDIDTGTIDAIVSGTAPSNDTAASEPAANTTQSTDTGSHADDGSELDAVLSEQLATEGGQGGEDDDYEEAEYEGRTHKLPKGWKEALLRHQDYTKKTQELSEKQKDIEGIRTAYQQREQMMNADLGALVEFHTLEQQIAQFAAINWDELSDEDPSQAQKLERHYRALVSARDSRAQQLAARHHQMELEKQSDSSKQLEQFHQDVSREIKGWGPELHKQLTDYAGKTGYSEQEIQTIRDPRAMKVLHKAHLYDQAMQRMANKSQQSPQNQIRIPNQVRGDGSGSGASKQPLQMNANDLLKAIRSS